MILSNTEKVRSSFTVQANEFNNALSFSSEEYLKYVVSAAEIRESDSVLEAAAGTCACGRAIAPHAASVVCLDVTPAMLESGRREAEKDGLCNMVFVKGDIYSLPFLSESFDVVISRLAFHHFPDIQKPFSEMTRVLRSGGRIILIDMEAAEENLRRSEDEIEALRDVSHVRNLSADEMRDLFVQNSLEIIKSEITKIPVELNAWLDLTQTPEREREIINRRLSEELSGGAQTGFYPYFKDEKTFFDQRWIMTIGRKPQVK